jgi:hypothetical protein
MTDFTESVVEQAGLAWLESLGWSVKHGPDIAPETPAAERKGGRRNASDEQRHLVRQRPREPKRGGTTAKRRRPAGAADPLWDVVEENASLILSAYAEHEAKRPVLLFDIHEGRLYVYPYAAFKADLSARSQASLTEQYEAALANDEIVLFVRDTVARKLVSYSLPRT